jgi:hypothetical protein
MVAYWVIRAGCAANGECWPLRQRGLRELAYLAQYKRRNTIRNAQIVLVYQPEVPAGSPRLVAQLRRYMVDFCAFPSFRVEQDEGEPKSMPIGRRWTPRWLRARARCW